MSDSQTDRTEPADPIRVTSQVNERSGTVFNLHYLVARDAGFFREEGLDVEFVEKADTDTPITPVEDHTLVSSFGATENPFEQGRADLYRACEWGQIRRSHDSAVGGQVAYKRPAVTSQAIFVRPDSDVHYTQQLAGRTVGVNFHHGSHYVAIQTLEGFVPDDEIRIVHVGGPRQRFDALLEGTVDAVPLMEPYITAAEKLGLRLIAEAFYLGSEIASPTVDPEVYAAVNRALAKAAALLNEDPRPHLHYLVDELPSDITTLTVDDFRKDRFRYIAPQPYSQVEFDRTYAWMVKWGLIDATASFSSIVEEHLPSAV